MATYAIGDIQGCFDSLRQLLDLVAFNAGRDRLWFVGDLVNRGPHSLETLRFVRGLGSAALTVQGNHDLHLSMVDAGFGRKNDDDTIAPILAAPDRAELMAWLRSRPLMHVEGEYALVHAGLLPQWSVARARELAAEVESALIAENYREFLGNLFGSKPSAWDEQLQGWDRLRLIVNAMTRMRFCTREGVIEFRTKGPVDSAPAGCLPWFAVPGRKSTDHTLICGHWSALGLRIEPGLMALDSGCLWGGTLTAVRLEDRKVFQISCPCSVAPSGWD
jgi:bis(5'-nucleosyl)-tetraphosphatase (symmetrical)